MPPASAPWTDWIAGLGHDTYAYPLWITEQQLRCRCDVTLSPPLRNMTCFDPQLVDWRKSVSRAQSLDWCTAKAWLLEHMPEFDLHFLPNSVTVNATSMLDDVIAFSLMADRAAPWSASVPLATKLTYLLPYAGCEPPARHVHDTTGTGTGAKQE